MDEATKKECDCQYCQEESDSEATARILAEIQDTVYERIQEEGVFPNEPHLLRMLSDIVSNRLVWEAMRYGASNPDVLEQIPPRL